MFDSTHGQRNYDGLLIEPGPRTTHVDGVAIELTALEFDVLASLAEHSPNVVRTMTLAEDAWGQASYFDRRALETTISRLRKKLGDPAKEPRFIETVRSVGYRMRRGPSRTHIASFLFDGELRILSAWAEDWAILGGKPEQLVGSRWLPPFDNHRIRRSGAALEVARELIALGVHEVSSTQTLRTQSAADLPIHFDVSLYAKGSTFTGAFVESYSSST